MGPGIVGSTAIIAAALFACSEQQSPTPEPERQAKESLAALLNADDLEKMCALPKKWTSTLSPEAQKALVIALLRKLEAFPTKKLKAPSRYGDVIDRFAPLPPEQSTKDIRHEYQSGQNIMAENGRCAWALEVMLDITLREFTNDMRRSEREAYVDSAWKTIVPDSRRFLEETPEMQADKALDRLLDATRFRWINYLPDLWYHTLPAAAKKKLLVKMLQKLNSTKELKIEMDKHYPGFAVRSRVEAGKQKWLDDVLHLGQDIFLENGRCAYAIERLLDFDSSAIFTEEVGKDPKKLEEAIRKFTLDVIAHMDLPKTYSKSDHEK